MYLCNDSTSHASHQNSAPGLVFDFLYTSHPLFMDYTKLPLTIEEQIGKLKSRGLKFKDEEKAISYLHNISYYRLRAYTYPFQDNELPNQPFNIDVSFDEIIDLYVFDRKLRLLIFDAIEKIEVALRTQIIYNYALSYGSHWQLNPELYRNLLRFETHIASLQNEVERSSETFIDHYKKTYSNPIDPPCWMSLEVASMGLLSKIFENLRKNSVKLSIVHHFGLIPNSAPLGSLFSVFQKVLLFS